jgi:hypothetical protein
VDLGIDGSTSTKTQEYGKALTQGFGDGVNGISAGDALGGAFKKLAEDAIFALEFAFGALGEGSSSEKAKNAGRAIVYGVRDGITEKSNALVFAESAVALILAAAIALNSAFGISSTDAPAKAFNYVGQGIALAASNGIASKSVAGTFSSSASSLASAAGSAMNSAFGIYGTGLLGLGTKSASKFEYIGNAISNGIATGITKSTSTITTAAKAAADAAYQAAKKALGIASPSKVFAEIGLYSGLGIAQGIEKSTSAIEETIGSLSDDMYAKLNDAVSSQVARNSSMFDNLTGAVNAQSDRISDAVDIDALAQKIWDKAPEIGVNMDGQKVGTSGEPYVSDRQGEKVTSKNRRGWIG